MPYITQKLRRELDHDHGRKPHNSGELSFCISEQIHRFMQACPNGGFEGTISKVYGALEAAKLAFEQEIVIPYEQNKRLENGSVYEN